MTSDKGDIIWTGDFSEELKDKITRHANFLTGTGSEGFAQSIAGRLKMKEVIMYGRERDGKTHCKVIFELTVDEGTHRLCRGDLHLA